MKFSKHSHCAGEQGFPSKLLKEVETAIKAISAKPKSDAAVKTKMRDAFLESIHSAGWSGEVSVSKESGMTITSMKEEVGLCLQTGNMSRMYADLMKLQKLYLDNSISAAAIVVPSKEVAKELGSNIAASDRLLRELDIFKKVYFVPTLVFSLEQP